MCPFNSTHRRRGNLAALVSGSALTAVQVVFDARLLSVRCDTMVIGCCLMHWHSEVAFADGSVVRLENEAAIQEAIMTNGPVQAAFSVWSDFMQYKEGVYSHVSGLFEGGHSVKIIGWGVDDATSVPYCKCLLSSMECFLLRGARH